MIRQDTPAQVKDQVFSDLEAFCWLSIAQRHARRHCPDAYQELKTLEATIRCEYSELASKRFPDLPVVEWTEPCQVSFVVMDMHWTDNPARMSSICDPARGLIEELGQRHRDTLIRLYDALPFHGFGLGQALFQANWVDISRWLQMLRQGDKIRDPWQRFAVTTDPDDPQCCGIITPLNSPLPTVVFLLDTRWGYWHTTPEVLRNRSDRNREAFEYSISKWNELQRRCEAASPENPVYIDDADFDFGEPRRGKNAPLMGGPWLSRELRELVKSTRGAIRWLRAFHAFDKRSAEAGKSKADACLAMAADFDGRTPPEVSRADFNALTELEKRVESYRPCQLPWLGSG